MDQILDYYRAQAMENLNNQSLHQNSTSIYPQNEQQQQFDYLIFDNESPMVNHGRIKSTAANQINIAFEILLLFAHYLIAFPVFLLCWIALISYLKRRGHINSSEADSMIEELKNVKISATSPFSRPPIISTK